MGTGRIGVKPIQTNALLLAQKKNGAAEINETSLKHFETKSQAPTRDPSPSKGSTSSGGKGSKGKEKTIKKDEDGEGGEEEDSGDEAEKLDEKQMNEIDSIYRK
jgi:DNA repair protein RAD5